MVLIYGIKEKLNPIKSKMSIVIYSCLMSALGLPENKRFHRFILIDKENFLYSMEGGRTDSCTVTGINLMEGRENETIKSLIDFIFGEFDRQLGMSNTDVEISVHQQPRHCRSFSGITGDEVKDLAYKVSV